MHNNNSIHITCYTVHLNTFIFNTIRRVGDAHIQAMDLSIADGVYSQIDRSTTGAPHHTSNILSHTYSSLVNVQQNSKNEEELLPNYSARGFEENMTGEINQALIVHKPEPIVVYSTVVRQTSGEKVTVKTTHQKV